VSTFTEFARPAVAHFVPRAGPALACSACGQPHRAGLRLISGPRVYLCSDCFARAAQQLAPRRPPAGALRCRFCRQLRAPTDVTHAGEVAACADCLGLMDEILAEARQASRP
jgi:hypothetical protein